MKHLPLRECGYAIVFVLALFLLYGGAYFAMMQRLDLGISAIAGQETPMVEYRCGGEWAETFFGPAHEVDRQLRPDLWKGEREMAEHRHHNKALKAALEKLGKARP
jgi:hypothetical protein